MSAIKDFTLGEVQASEVTAIASTFRKTDLDEFAMLSIHSENMVLDGIDLDHHLGYVLVTAA